MGFVRLGRFMDYSLPREPVLVDLYQCTGCNDVIRVLAGSREGLVCHKCGG